LTPGKMTSRRPGRGASTASPSKTKHGWPSSPPSWSPCGATKRRPPGALGMEGAAQSGPPASRIHRRTRAAAMDRSTLSLPLQRSAAKCSGSETLFFQKPSHVLCECQVKPIANGLSVNATGRRCLRGKQVTPVVSGLAEMGQETAVVIVKLIDHPLTCLWIPLCFDRYISTPEIPHAL